MCNKILIRPATQNDAAALLDIYKRYIIHTSFTPEIEVPTITDFKQRIKNITDFYPYLVCLQENKIVGYAHASRYRFAAGHQWSAEVSVYFSPQYQGKGLSKTLYETLLSVLKLQNIINIFAGIVLPNDQSVAFHKKFHFTEAGIFKDEIYKSGSWHDVQWMQLSLKDHDNNPPFPKPFSEVIHSKGLKEIMKRVNTKY